MLGAEDDKTVHWKAENDFFYYPGQSLRLPTPCPEGMTPYDETPAMATGNDCYNAAPGINDWFETVKINYCDFHTGTWDKMYDIIAYWMDKGVDGFRCDMVELVPPQFFKWLIAKAKDVRPDIIFIAEVYKKDLYAEYIYNVGFDYLYDKSGLYDTIRIIVERNEMPVEDWTSTVGITRNWQYLGDLQPHMLNFLENHDEQRFCSDFFGKSTSNALAPLYVSLLLNTAPYMIYFGEEVGEKGMDHEGFSGRDGRTTIFDWWSVDSVRRLRKVIKSGAYKSSKVNELISAGMNREEAEFFVRFNKVTRYASEDESIKEGMTYDLCYCNYDSEGFDKDRHFAFLRYFKGHTVLVAANFSRSDAKMHVTIPHHAFEWMQIPVTPTRYPGMSITVEVPAADAVTITLI
jgi:glycosidase